MIKRKKYAVFNAYFYASYSKVLWKFWEDSFLQISKNPKEMIFIVKYDYDEEKFTCFILFYGTLCGTWNIGKIYLSDNL